jgi:hypothetical protein
MIISDFVLILTSTVKFAQLANYVSWYTEKKYLSGK